MALQSPTTHDRAGRWLPAGIRGVVSLGVLLWVVCSSRGAAPEPVTKESQLKAAFLYNFTKFVEWPASRFATPTAPIVLGVLGDNPFGVELSKAVEGRSQNGRTFVVTNLTSVAAAVRVHLLFVPCSSESQLDTLGCLHDAGVLTVGESTAFQAHAGAITFTREGDKIRFEINLESTERARLKVSSKLLQLAKAVHRKTNAP